MDKRRKASMSSRNLVDAVLRVERMSFSERERLAHEVCARQLNLFASVIVWQRYGATLVQMEVVLNLLLVFHEAMKISGGSSSWVIEETVDDVSVHVETHGVSCDSEKGPWTITTSCMSKADGGIWDDAYGPLVLGDDGSGEGQSSGTMVLPRAFGAVRKQGKFSAKLLSDAKGFSLEVTDLGSTDTACVAGQCQTVTQSVPNSPGRFRLKPVTTGCN